LTDLGASAALAKKQRAAIIVAKLDRIARDVRFLLELIDQGVRLCFVDLPGLEIEGAAGRFTLTMMAGVAEFERRRIAERTRAALAAKRARGEKLGNANLLRPQNEARIAQGNAHAEKLRGTIEALRARRLSERAVVVELNRAGVPSRERRGWGRTQVRRVMARLEA
jgi:DNA invertase Pin-like site-specific DNA recombinase